MLPLLASLSKEGFWRMPQSRVDLGGGMPPSDNVVTPPEVRNPWEVGEAGSLRNLNILKMRKKLGSSVTNGSWAAIKCMCNEIYAYIRTTYEMCHQYLREKIRNKSC